MNSTLFFQFILYFQFILLFDSQNKQRKCLDVFVYIFFHLILSQTSKYSLFVCFFWHFTNERTEVLGSKVPCPKSHREIVVKFADSGRTIFSDFFWGAPSPVLNDKGGAVGTSIWYSDNKV